jgi:Excreted virulence factor EspC, type VII ESX diderm/EspA/EspE family
LLRKWAFDPCYGRRKNDEGDSICMGGWHNVGDVYSTINAYLGTADHLKGLKDDPAQSAMGLGADFIGVGQAFGEQAATALGATKFAAAAATPVINAGLLVLMGMNNSAGFGTPDQGQDFGTGAKAFGRIGETLSTTGAPTSWTGDGSAAYTNQNGLQEGRAQAMQRLDQSVGEVLAREADQVERTRKTIDASATALTFAIPMAIYLNTVPYVGPAMSLEYQLSAVMLTVPMAEARFLQMTAQSTENASKIGRAGAGYDRIGSEPDPANPRGRGEVSVAPIDLWERSAQHDEVATDIRSAGRTTRETARNVWFSHGLVCAPTNAAVTGAVSARSTAAGTMQGTSSVLASRLDASAGLYDSTDQQQRNQVEGELHPR